MEIPRGSKADLHIHTLVSDGENTPAEILRAAGEIGLEVVSITDHDAVGAYFNFGGDLFVEAADLGIKLIPGIELDADYRGEEVHILGYGLDPAHPGLKAYLRRIHGLRRKRIGEQVEEINRYYQKEVVSLDEVFLPYRDTLMKPHLVHRLLKRGIFKEYRDAARWLAAQIKVETEVPKSSYDFIIRLIIDAGGEAVLAHPGFLVKEKGFGLRTMVTEMKEQGLAGIEMEYPYYNTAPCFATRESEREMVERVGEVAEQLRLFTTRGSDAHNLERLRELNPPHRIDCPGKPG